VEHEGDEMLEVFVIWLAHCGTGKNKLDFAIILGIIYLKSVYVLI